MVYMAELTSGEFSKLSSLLLGVICRAVIVISELNFNPRRGLV
jgi:hypothetical protein